MGLPRSVCGVSTAAFTPAATSHTNGDSCGGIKEFTGFEPSVPILIQGASMTVATGTNVTTAWALHLFLAALATPIADDAAFDVVSAERTNYWGSIVIPQLVDLGSTLYIDSTMNLNKFIIPATTSLFAHLVNGTTATLEAVAHTVRLHWRAA